MNKLPGTARIDIANIFLLIVSAIAAVIIPFELFLFVYAVLGPLHYLTEISWLHDKNYFSQSKNDVVVLVVVSVLVTVLAFKQLVPDTWEAINGVYISRLTFIGFGAALFFVYIRKTTIRWIGIAALVLLSGFSDNLVVFFGILLPTIIHVYVFTFLFMLAGALKSRSLYGYICVALHLAFPFVLYFFLQGIPAKAVTSYGMDTYKFFQSINFTLMQLVSNSPLQGDGRQLLFSSPVGITIMRFVAFSYTYHYLNWFSKTEVIRWHQVPKKRLAAVALIWIASIGLYLLDYSIGLKWLLLLSFMHITLEWPLNFISIRNIGKELKARLSSTQNAQRT